MNSENPPPVNLNGIKISLCLKLIIISWSLVVAIQGESLQVSIIYLFLCIVFAGLFVFQLSYYRKKKKELDE